MVDRMLVGLLKDAGVEINGDNPWDIRVHDERFGARVMRELNLGLGESYMDGWWDCERLDELFHRLLTSGIEKKIRGSPRYLLRLLPAVLFNLQSRARSRLIAKRHYDLGNDLFLSFLGATVQYSCAYFEGTDDLDEAQRNKLRMICEKLGLCPGEHLLDIGCGFGGLARFAAAEYGCEVTAVNISREQMRHARDICAGLPVRVLDQDYRAIEGRFDKIASVGMFEHVGRRNYRTFMRVAHRCLSPGGVFLLHTIGGNVTCFNCDPWIAKHIFPVGMLPSAALVGKAAEGLFVIEDWHNIGPHYDKTLMAWNRNFQAAWPGFAERYGERFRRMWEYYLLSCAGAFRARRIQAWQVVMTKDGVGRPQPACRPAFAGRDEPVRWN